MKTYDELLKENEELKKKIDRENSKTRCYRCGGKGEIWTYDGGDVHCPVCYGSGRC